MTLHTTRCITCLSTAVGLLFGCASDVTDSTTPTDTVFESDAPTSGSQTRFTTPTGSDAEIANDGSTDTNKEATRSIEEADIVKTEGNRLYALSQYGGLNIIDLSDPDRLSLLGRKKVRANPFEMYVRDSIVLALYNGYGEYLEGSTEGYWNWIVTSYVMAIDTTDPKNPTILGQFPVSGSITDSRIVGDILYVIGFENNGCWGCESGQRTTVLSLNVKNPTQLEKADELAFSEDNANRWSWTRSVFVNDKRMYVAGPAYGINGPIGSKVQVVDISDPAGKLVLGTAVDVSGTVNSRWQMDEYAGYLRVISQPNAWSMTEPVSVQTFKVDSAQNLNPRGYAALSIPPNETLKSVRFDGPRGYAITAEQTDPLFTIDLANPDSPRQAGALVMPGWVYYLEPRDNRLLSLGFDQGNPDGAMTVSVFDVTDLDHPTMPARVNFGGDWAWTTEGQDQIHKAFQVLDDAGLVLMPFSGWEASANACGGISSSGIQLIDWYKDVTSPKNDTLSRRGLATLIGQPRRGFLHHDRLLAVSEERVEAFDITDRDKPKSTASVKTAENVTSTLIAGKTVVKLGSDWYSGMVSLDTTTLEAVETPQPLGHLDLAFGSSQCASSINAITSTDDRVFVLVNDIDEMGVRSPASRLVTVDVSAPSNPKVIAQADLAIGEREDYWRGTYGGVVVAGQSTVSVGNALVVLSTQPLYNDGNVYRGVTTRVRVVNVTDPSEPGVFTIDVPGENGTTGLFVSGKTVALGYYLSSPTDPNKVRFYVTQIDVSHPDLPKVQTPINVPGSLIGFDATSSNVITTDYQTITVPDTTPTTCYDMYPSSAFVYDEKSGFGTCITTQHTIHLAKLGEASATLLGQKSLDPGERINQIAQGRDRLFFTGGSNLYYGLSEGAVAQTSSSAYWYSFNEGKLPLFVVSGLSSDEFALGKLTLESGNQWSNVGNIVAWKESVLLSTGFQGKLVVVDGSVPADPLVRRTVDVNGYVNSLSVADGFGIASMGFDGVTTVSLE